MSVQPPAVRVTIPAAAQYVRSVRLIAAGLAADLGFDVDGLEDVRVAVDELCGVFLTPAPNGSIEVRFLPSDGALEVTGHYVGDAEISPPDPLVAEILAATTDELEVPSRGSPTFRFLRRP
jgi:anti-sigma regulatory factor (Ser/Thr protein kinase)